MALEALLGQMAVVGHGRETLQNASRHLETLKAKGKKVLFELPVAEPKDGGGYVVLF